MSESEQPLVLAEGARLAPGDDELSRRIARHCAIASGARVLALGPATLSTARLLAREYGAQIQAASFGDAALERLLTLAKQDGAESRITAVAGEPLSTLPAASVQSIVAEGGLSKPGATFIEVLKQARGLLAPRGRLAMLCRARVGRQLPDAVQAHYRERGIELLFPRQLLQALEGAGYEPLAAESLAETVVDDYFASVEAALARGSDNGAAAALRKELDVYRREGGRSSVGWVLAVGRRKEPGEPPPAARGGD